MTTPATPAALFAFLDSLGIAHKTVTHPPLHTVEESQALRGDLPGGHTKNLFLKDKKGQIWLVTCREDRRVRMGPLERAIGAARLSFGKPELLAEVLGVLPGSVTVLALVNDRKTESGQGRVRLVLDQQLLQEAVINCHPLHNEATTAISTSDLLRFIAACGHEPLIVDFDAIERESIAD